MTRDEVVTELLARIRRYLAVPRGLEGTTQGKMIVTKNLIELAPFVYSNANELLKLCTDYWGDKFIERLDKELAALHKIEVNKVLIDNGLDPIAIEQPKLKNAIRFFPN